MLPSVDFTIVRHGETNWNSIKRIQGQLSHYTEESGEKVDITLTQKGKEQVQALAKKLSTFAFTRCYSSDLLRAVDSARILTKGRTITYEQDARLRERSRGEWEGRFESEFSAAAPEKKRDVETDESMRNRLFEFLRDTAAANPGGNVLVVGHERVITNILVQVKQLQCRPNDIPVEHTGMLQLRFHEGVWSILSHEGITLK